MENEDLYIQIIKRHSFPLEPIPSELTPGKTPVSGGIKISSIKAVFFDIYGTLFISGSGDASATEKKIDIERFGVLLKNYGVRSNPANVLQRYFDKIKGHHDFLRLLGVDFPEVQVEKIWMKVLDLQNIQQAMSFAVEFESIFNPVWPMPGALELVKYLGERGIKMGIISNAQFFTPLLFNALLGYYIEEIGFCERLLFYSFKYEHAKPSPFLFCRATLELSKYNITPGQILYVGNDILNDILPAAGVGFHTALFSGDKRSLRLRRDDPRCTGVDPDVTITDLGELVEYIV